MSCTYGIPAKSRFHVPGVRFQHTCYRKTEIMLRSFRDLIVWQKSMQLATVIYKLTQGFP
jgi:hypothetical protein